MNEHRMAVATESSHIVEQIDADLTVSGLMRLPGKPLAHAPLIVAIPGGSYTSSYFDIGACSLLARAAALGFPTLALDRPGYGSTTPLPAAEASIERNAEQLDRALNVLCGRAGFSPRAGIFLIGHSIGAAVAVNMAARKPQWPLLGVAISGVGLTAPPEVSAAWSSLPETAFVSVPPQAKDALMFGPSWTYEAEVPGLAHAADAPTPRIELIDIVSRWPHALDQLAKLVSVPVHYRLAEFEKLWVADRGEIDRFAAAFSAAPLVDARLFESAGHCIDLHRAGADFQLEQLAFALRCSTRQSSAPNRVSH